MTNDPRETTSQVRRQYEGYPYPPRRPQDERKRLVRTSLDCLDVINHYCFRGRRDFRRDFRVLVAGGGTGDATIYLAEQLRETDAEVVYLDLSSASLAVAKARAEIRGLENITWLTGSLLDLPEMGLGAFDYISCTGVLHHLADPPAGLAALRAVLRDDGAIFLMLYGLYGRQAIYRQQELIRQVNHGIDDDGQRVANARAVLDVLPRAEDARQADDADIYDMFLHSTDRPYTIEQVFDLLDSAGLGLVELAANCRRMYQPESIFGDSPVMAQIRTLPVRRRLAIGELACGTIARHDFYAAVRTDTVADPGEEDNVPFSPWQADFGQQISARLAAGRDVSISLPDGSDLNVPGGHGIGRFLKYVDDRRTIGQIVDLVRADLGGAAAREDVLGAFGVHFETLRSGDLLVLRAASTPRTAPVRERIGG